MGKKWENFSSWVIRFLKLGDSLQLPNVKSPPVFITKKSTYGIHHKCFKFLVGMKGFEPSTP